VPTVNPTKQYYNFVGWNLGSDPYDFDTPVIGNITLVAQWEKVPISSVVITDTNSNAAPSLVTVPRNSIVQFDYTVNIDALPEGIVWTVSNASFATITDDTTGMVKVLNKTGTLLLTATAPNGVSHSIILRVV
jgi:uncharacterized repeat protein (TIGR02543 family)